MDVAFAKLEEMVSLAEQAETDDRWQFKPCNLQHFGLYSTVKKNQKFLNHIKFIGKTRKDLLESYLLWAQKPEDEKESRFNVSKCFRRLTNFANWIADNQEFVIYFV
jgi:hypothetical protein